MTTTIIIIILIIVICYFLLASKNRETTEKTKASVPSSTKNKSGKTWGKFNVVGYHHLSDEVKKKVWKELKVGDDLILVPDPNNEYDNTAIKVIFQNTQIGWFPKDHDRKLEIFKILMENRLIKTVCTENIRRGDYDRNTKPSSDGTWNDKYLGMTQFVQAKFSYVIT